MEPAELYEDVKNGSALNAHQFIYDSPIHSDVESKLRQLLIRLAADNKICGIQVCAYKDGEVVIDTAAGMLGKDDPRPVQLDSLFPVFSATKGVAAGMLHWLVDNGKLNLEENIANIWPGFGINGKDLIKVHHVLNHTSGLHNAMSNTLVDPPLMSDWNACLNSIQTSTPESEPGHKQLYHYSSFGYLCGGIIEHASGKKFQEILEEAIVHPLNVEGELYIGIPPGVESRLASLTFDTEDLKARELASLTFDTEDLKARELASLTFDTEDLKARNGLSLEVRRAIVPSANGHFSARALARYYASLAAGGIVPPPHSPSSKPLLGSNPHNPKSASSHYEKRGNEVAASKDTTKTGDHNHSTCHKDGVNRIFHGPKVHDAFLGVGVYGSLALPDGAFGLGFVRNCSKEGVTGFGHSGLGGSTGFCDIKHKFSIAVLVNTISVGAVTGRIVQLVCSELNVPVPLDYAQFAEGESYIKLN
ncbi:hypothetical protein IFM89_014977 [Coptis chinensis]|uniref:Beta-lactamase-related domain-containing protein n=1 Tax=Coptis chinensis TaxID=261450 RepID=A0A835HMD7_9MAGN|nr:hypothetical protein IFM89_014977 [Coptis chinensis]